MNLIDTSTNSPHHLYWKHIGISNENVTTHIAKSGGEGDLTTRNQKSYKLSFSKLESTKCHYTENLYSLGSDL